MIGTDSRYRSAVIQTVQASDGRARREIRVQFPVSFAIQYTYHRVKQGDRLDKLAAAVYGNPRLWWVIANANPEVLLWLDLEVGSQIRIPNA